MSGGMPWRLTILRCDHMRLCVGITSVFGWHHLNEAEVYGFCCMVHS
jgi:hypothetical protein